MVIESGAMINHKRRHKRSKWEDDEHEGKLVEPMWMFCKRLRELAKRSEKKERKLNG